MTATAFTLKVEYDPDSDTWSAMRQDVDPHTGQPFFYRETYIGATPGDAVQHLVDHAAGAPGVGPGLPRQPEPYATCPGCSGATDPVENAPGVRRCQDCEGIVGETDRSTARRFVDLGKWAPGIDEGEVRADALKTSEYFDFTFPGPDPVRVHGWYDPASRGVVQFG